MTEDAGLEQLSIGLEMSLAELKANLLGNASPVDTFTGCQTDFHPFLLDGGYFATSILRNPPPQLPGTDPEKRLHFARGTKSGPLYVSPNVLPNDPLWLRLAYMRYPLDSEGTRAFLESIVPSGTPRFSPVNREEHAPRRMSLEQMRWIYELQALAALSPEAQANPYEAQIVPFFARGWLSFARGKSQERTLAGLWAQYQHLAISVLWAWGMPHERLQLLYCEALADEVGRLYQGTHQLAATLTNSGQLDHPQNTAAISIDRARFTHNGTSCWRIVPDPPSVARVAEGLYEAVGNGGAFLASCPHCARLYWKPDARKLFCGEYCRTAYNRTERRRGQAGGRRAQEKKEKQKAPIDVIVSSDGSIIFEVDDWD